MPPKKMEEKMLALENEMATLKVSLAEMRAQAAADQERLVSLLTQSKEAGSPDKSIGNSRNGEDSGSSGNAEMKKLLQQLQGDAEIYFRVQRTRSEIRVDLAQLCMDGHTIHFFKALMDDDEHLT